MQIFNLKCLLDRFRLLKLKNKFAMHVTFQDRQIRFPFFFLADAKVATSAVNQCWQRGRSWKYAPLPPHIWVFALDSISDCIFRVVVIIKGKIMHSLRHNWAWTLNTWQQIPMAFANLFPFLFQVDEWVMDLGLCSQKEKTATFNTRWSWMRQVAAAAVDAVQQIWRRNREQIPP